MNLTKNLIIYFLALFCLFYQTSKLKAAEYSPLPIKLSLKQAIEETLNNNTSIAVQKFNSKINEQAILEKKADFDTTLDFEFSAVVLGVQRGLIGFGAALRFKTLESQPGKSNMGPVSIIFDDSELF